MFSLRTLVPALVASVAFAQSDDCSTDDTFTIQNSGDASSLSACQTFTGNVAIATSVAGDISIAGVQEITGDFTVSGPNGALNNLGANDLRKIGGTFKIDSASVLSALTFPQLTSVKAIDFRSNAALRTLNAGSEITQAESVVIQDSQFANLKGINLKSAATIDIQNNKFLKEITLQATNITSSLIIASNGENCNVSLPNLADGGRLEFRNIGSLDIQSLESAGAQGGGLSVQESSLESLSAANLTSVGFLVVGNNTALNNVSLPVLSTASQDIRFGANDELSEIDLPSLTEVKGALDIAGKVSDVKLDKIEHVDGVFNLKSTENIDSLCSTFKGMEGSGKPFAAVQCATDSDPTNTNGGQGTTTGGSNGGDTGAASRVGLTAFLGLTGISMALLL